MITSKYFDIEKKFEKIKNHDFCSKLSFLLILRVINERIPISAPGIVMIYLL